LIEEQRRLTPDDVAATVRTAAESAILLVPSDVGPPDDRFSPPEPWTEPAVVGAIFRLRRRGFLKGRPTAHLVVGDDALSFVDDDGPGTILFDDVGVVAVYDDRVWIVAADTGRYLRLALESYEDPEALERMVRTRVPDSRIVEMGRPYWGA
jgi:hypothetical protein